MTDHLAAWGGALLAAPVIGVVLTTAGASLHFKGLSSFTFSWGSGTCHSASRQSS